MNEFELIAEYFQGVGESRPDVVLGIGDDCAIVEVPPSQQLVTTVDTLISGMHFPQHTRPFDIAYKAVAVNLSDLAAMGATPAWITLAITLPEVNESWLQEFALGLRAMCSRHDVALVGGDTTRGDLSISITAYGFVPKGQAVRRDGAKLGDKILVSGHLGDAGLALAHALGRLQLPDDYLDSVMERLERPQPRVKLGQSLVGLASSAIDISDGLIGDLSHILTRSHVGARIQLDALPLSPALIDIVPREHAHQLALGAGDDYELCFTLADSEITSLMARAAEFGIILTIIGDIVAEPGLQIYNSANELSTLQIDSFQHF